VSAAPLFSVVVPCYNEASGLRALLEAFAAAGAGMNFELVLVDNGSTDGTAAELDRLLPGYPFVTRVNVPANRGYGRGIRSGLAAASPSSRFLGWTHGDLQFPPAAVFEAARLAGSAGGPVLVKGSRRGRPLVDRLFTAGMALFCGAALGTRLWDISGQPVLFSRALAERLACAPDDFSFDLYAYAAAVRAGFAVSRFPVPVAGRARGSSSWNTGLPARLALARRMAAACLRMRASLPGGRT
jgi:glycosyltransferase involved in cell wall biosynthesis